MKKTDLEAYLDEYITDNSDSFNADPTIGPLLTGYFQSRAKASGSPVKKEAPVDDKPLKVSRRRVTKVAEEIAE